MTLPSEPVDHHLSRGITNYSDGGVSGSSFNSAASTTGSALGTDLLADQTDKVEFPKHRQDQQASPLFQSQPPLLGSTHSNHYDANTDPAATPQSDGRFDSSHTDSSLSTSAHHTPPPLHHAPRFPTGAPSKTAVPQGDSNFDSLAAASSQFARTRYAPYRLPRRRPTSLPAHKFTGWLFPLSAGRCLHSYMTARA